MDLTPKRGPKPRYNKARLESLLAEGASTRRIAQELGMSRQRAWQIVKARGYKSTVVRGISLSL